MPGDLTGVKLAPEPAGEGGIVAAVFSLVENHAQSASDWYWRAKRWPSRLSKLLRFLALVLFGLGALPPFLHAIGVGAPPGATGPGALPAGGSMNWSAWGYLALAVGTSALAFDHFFGLSTAYTRYVTTAMAIERARHEFHVDWYGLLAEAGGRVEAGVPSAPFIARAAAFLKTILDLVDRETQDWVAEFRANLAELEKIGKEQREASRPGRLDVTVTGAVAADEEVVVGVDSVERARLKGAGTTQVGPVYPGTHVVAARNLKTGMQGLSTTLVAAGAATPVTVTVPAKV